MIKKLLLVLALTSLLPFAASAPGYAADPPPTDPAARRPSRPIPTRHPIRPTAWSTRTPTYPTDEGESTDQGETGAAARRTTGRSTGGGNSPPD